MRKFKSVVDMTSPLWLLNQSLSTSLDHWYKVSVSSEVLPTANKRQLSSHQFELLAL